MELDGKRPQLRVVDTLAGTVIGVGIANPAQFHRIAVHSVTVVLAGDIGADTGHIPDRLVYAPVAVFQLIGAAPGGQSCQLVAKADTKHRDFSQKPANLLDLIGILRRVAGAVGEHESIRRCGQNFFRGDSRGQNRDLTAALLKLPDDIALGAVVDERHPEAPLPLRRMDDRRLTGNRLHHAGHGVGPNRRQVSGNFIADGGVHHTMLPDDAGQFPGVHAA